MSILLIGATALAALGAYGHYDANETNKEAEKILQDANSTYNLAKAYLERSQNKTEKALLKLGYDKKDILDSSVKSFLNIYSQIKDVEIKNSAGINEISRFAIDQQGTVQLRKMSDIYSSVVRSGATGAAAGTVIALAISGALPVISSGLSVAGSLLSIGEVGMAAGIAGSALSYAAAVTPLSAIAAPVVLFTGISAGIKADENLEKAKVSYAEAKAAADKMNVSRTLCDAITEKADMYDNLLVQLNNMFAECVDILAGVVRRKEEYLFKKNFVSSDFSQKEISLIAVTRAMAGAIKKIIDTPILTEKGTMVPEPQDVIQIHNKISNYEQETRRIEETTFDVSPYVATKLGIKEYKKGNFKNAINNFNQAANQENAEAQYWLGKCFSYGTGVRMDKEKAMRWYKKAAEGGYIEAQVCLGNCYFLGIGTSKNETEAVKWYKKAAQRGDNIAQYNLGNCYYHGYGTNINKEEAKKFFELSSEQGNKSARKFLREHMDLRTVETETTNCIFKHLW